MATFGYTTAGGTNATWATGYFLGDWDTSPANGTVDSFTAYCWSGNTSRQYKAVLVDKTALTILANGVGAAVNFAAAAAWTTSTFSTPPTIVSGTTYVLGGVASAGANLRYDTGASGIGYDDTTNSFATPSDPTDATTNTNQYSVYATYTAAGGVTTEVTVIDGLYFYDGGANPSSVLDRSNLDSVMFDDAAHRILESLAVDPTLLGDAAYSDLSRPGTDSILLGSAGYADLSRSLLDNLFLADSVSHILDRTILDLLFLYDSATQEIPADNVTTTTVIDNLFLLDDAYSLREATALDSLFLRDDTFRELLGLLLDGVYFSDSLTTQRELSMLDALLLDSMQTRAIELLQTEFLLLGDSVTATQYLAAAVALRYARLSKRNYLGVVCAHRDRLGRSVGVHDYLGTSITFQRWRYQ